MLNIAHFQHIGEGRKVVAFPKKQTTFTQGGTRQPGMGNADDGKNDEQRYREGRNQAQGHTVITWD
jgi:hypothetical protein